MLFHIVKLFNPFQGYIFAAILTLIERILILVN